MSSRAGEGRSHLFMVRVWTEQIDAEHVEWRGKVQRVLSGETLYFRDWETMLMFLMGSTTHAQPDISDTNQKP